MLFMPKRGEVWMPLDRGRFMATSWGLTALGALGAGIIFGSWLLVVIGAMVLIADIGVLITVERTFHYNPQRRARLQAKWPLITCSVILIMGASILFMTSEEMLFPAIFMGLCGLGGIVAELLRKKEYERPSE
jgi:hypothetical protein